MCGHHHGRRGSRGMPNPEQWVERLQGYRDHLESELRKVQELIDRLAGGTQPPAESA